MQNHANYVKVLALVVFLLVSCGLPPLSQPTAIVLVTETPLEIRDAQIIGEPYKEISEYPVRADNCDGQSRYTHVGRSLSQEQTTFFQVEVGVGGLIKGTIVPETLQTELEARIQAALGRSLSTAYQQDISLDIETQPGTAYDHIIAWNETKISGIIDVVYPSGIAKVGFQKVIGVELYGRTSTPLICNVAVSPTVLLSPTDVSTVAPTLTSPITTNPPLPTLPPATGFTPVDLGTVVVPGYQESGVRFDIPSTGRYRIAIVGGAYSPWPADDYPGNQGWLTTVYIYKNHAVKWGARETGLIGPIDPDKSIGWGAPKPTQGEAEALALGMSVTIDLIAEDYLIFVPIDEQAAYSFPANNRGDITLNITLISEP